MNDLLEFVKDYVREYEKHMGPIKPCNCSKFRCRAQALLVKHNAYTPTEKEAIKLPAKNPYLMQWKDKPRNN